MKRYILWLIAIFVLIVLQSAVFIPLNFDHVNLLLVLIVVSLLFADFDFGLIFSTICGLILDFLSGIPDGIFAFSLVSIFLILYFVVNNVLAKEPSLLILFASVAVATLLFFGLFLLYNQIFKMFGLATVINYKSLLLFDLPSALVFNLLLTFRVLKYYTWVENLNRKLSKNDPQPVSS